MIKRFLSLLLIVTVWLSCNTTEPIIDPPINGDAVSNTIILTIEWTDLYRINLKWNKAEDDTLSNYLYNLIRRDENGNELTRAFYIAGNDTAYLDDNNGDSLGTGKTYSYRVKAFDNEDKLKDTSKVITASTLTPTSHNIEWTVDTLGQPGNFLYDVWGLDENNVYAVGGINLKEGGTTIIKWDGIKWNYHSFPDGSAYSIFGFSNTDFWVVGEWANRGFIGYFDGNSWSEYKSDYFYSKGDTVYPLRSVWGSSPDDVWAVGNNGTIIHWNGVEWKKVESPTTDVLNDIWGTGPNNIYAIGISISNQSKLLHYDGLNWKDITNQLPNFPRSFTSLWFSDDSNGFLVGNNITIYNGVNYSTSDFMPDRFLLAIRGRNSADVIASGQTGRVYHFNGIEWKGYPELWDPNIGNELRGIYIDNNIIILVGKIFGGAIIIKGERL